VSEQQVPFLINRPARVASGRRLRNFDIFDVALNHVH
jgi:phosphonoacetate hydrolase